MLSLTKNWYTLKQALKSELKGELNAALSKYSNLELAATVFDLITFPKYFLWFFVSVHFFGILTYFIGFFALDLSGFEYLSYGIFGFLLWVIEGTLIALILFTTQVRDDLVMLIDYTFSLSKNIYHDLKTKGTAFKNVTFKEVSGMLVRGVFVMVVFPALSRTIERKIPMLGGLLSAIVQRVMSFALKRVPENEVLEKNQNSEDRNLPISLEKSKLNTVLVNRVSGILNFVRIPFIALAVFWGFCLTALLLALS